MGRSRSSSVVVARSRMVRRRSGGSGRGRSSSGSSGSSGAVVAAAVTYTDVFHAPLADLVPSTREASFFHARTAVVLAFLALGMSSGWKTVSDGAYPTGPLHEPIWNLAVRYLEEERGGGGCGEVAMEFTGK